MSRILSLFLISLSAASSVDIQPDALYAKLVNNELDLVLDVRTQAEWDLGHIEGATFAESLHNQTKLPSIIDGCQGECREIVVYCNSGNRASLAIKKLMDEFGFKGNISNGFGVKQWTAAGYSLINGTSVDPPCAGTDNVSGCSKNPPPPRLKVSKAILDPVPAVAGKGVAAKVIVRESGSGGSTATFDWGGGAKHTVSVRPEDSGVAVSRHVYRNPGIYKVRVKVNDKTGRIKSSPSKLVFVVASNGEKARIIGQAGDIFLNAMVKHRASGGFDGFVKARIKDRYHLHFQSTVIEQLMFFSDWVFATGRGVTRKGLEVGWDLVLSDGELKTGNIKDVVRLVIFKAGTRSEVLYDSQPRTARYSRPTRELASGFVKLKYS